MSSEVIQFLREVKQAGGRVKVKSNGEVYVAGENIDPDLAAQASQYRDDVHLLRDTITAVRQHFARARFVVDDDDALEPQPQPEPQGRSGSYGLPEMLEPIAHEMLIDDRRYLIDRIMMIPARERGSAIRGYVARWQAAAAAEVNPIKRANAGRYAANSWLLDYTEARAYSSA